MSNTRNKYYLLNLVFCFCLLTLLVNDHYLKYAIANSLTGKLSDIAGIIMLPFLLAFAFPKLKQHAVWLAAILFGFWKSPYSQNLIDLYNQYAFIQTSRIIDMTDLYVLLLLPIPYFVIRQMEYSDAIKIKNSHPLFMLLPTVAALMATSPPPSHYYTRTEGNLACYKCNITVNYNQNEIVDKLKNLDIVFDSIEPIDTIAIQRVPGLKNENTHVYHLHQLIIDNDTLRNLDFTMRTIKTGKTKIYFNGMQVSDDISTLKLEIKLRNYYKKILFKELKNMLL